MNVHESTEIEERLAGLPDSTRDRDEITGRVRPRAAHRHHALMTWTHNAAPCPGRSRGQRQGAECSGASSNPA